MDVTAPVSPQDQLLTRRQQLETVAADVGESPEIRRLLHEVDAALDRVRAGSFGICEVCRDPIEADRLRADPLTRFCLDHLTPTEQRALEHDLEVAARIQRDLLPGPGVAGDGWDWSYHYQPASTVSGDYCDVIRGDGNSVYFVVGDVAGHGIAAALLMSHLSAMLRTLIPLNLPMPVLMERVNRAFCESGEAMHYATLVCGRASSSGEVELCNAGHPPTLLLRDGDVVRIDATAVPIGMFCSTRFACSTLQLTAGDMLLLYTDGLIEAEDARGEEYGIDRLVAIAAAGGREPAAIVEMCMRDLARFRGTSPMSDDVTLFVMKQGGTS